VGRWLYAARSRRPAGHNGLVAGTLGVVLICGCVSVSGPSPSPSDAATTPIASQPASTVTPNPSELAPTPSGPTVEPSSSPGTGIIKLGIELPLSGDDGFDGSPTANGVLLAIKDANDGHFLSGYSLADSTLDDAVNGVHDPDKGADNMRDLVADPEVLGVVGPFNSNVARAQIPVSNEAGLAQCSPSALVPDLTQDGSEAYRFQGQDERNFFRVTAPYLVEGAAMAEFAIEHFAGHNVYVLDDDSQFGYDVAEGFNERFKELGGIVVGRDFVPFGTNNYKHYFNSAKRLAPDAVYLGVTDPADAAVARKQMVKAGMGDLPLLGPDSMLDFLPGGSPDAFITLVGRDNARGVYVAIPGMFELADDTSFESNYINEFGDAKGAYSAEAYVCAEVLLQGIQATATEAHGDLGAWRELVRSYMFDATAQQTFETALGTVSFDANGDLEQPPVGFFTVDVSAGGGRGDWIYLKQLFVTP
jgi:branched-chain amino acid transport system substrate-binding protein